MSAALETGAFILPLVGIALSWWSFRWAEEGAAPDANADDRWSDLDREEAQVQRGERYRARWCARICFNAGALLLAAAVPMGSAANHGHFDLTAVAGLAIITFAAAYAVQQVLRIWKNRRESAFEIYFGGGMPYLYDRGKTRDIYFRLNPMQLWTLPDRDWSKERKTPDIHEVVAKASKSTPGE